MTRFPRGVLCERTRAWAALAPDGELSELEHKLLDAHLARCVACSRFAVQVDAVAVELRAAALQPLPRPISISTWRRRPIYARVSTVGAAAAVAVMALGIASRGPLSAGEQESFQLPRVTKFAANEQAELRAIVRAELAATNVNRIRPARRIGNQPA